MQVAMLIPSEADWHSEPWWIDTPHAYEYFNKKSLAEAVALFVDNAICYQEDIMFMPLPCFRYYVRAYIDYLLSDASKDDSDAANCFFGIVEFRRDDILTSGDELRGLILDVLRHIGAGQEWYDADRGIYGDFADRAEAAKKLIGGAG